MKRYRRLAIVTVIAGVVIIVSCKTRFDTTTENLKVTATAADVRHGKDLVFSSCAGCHYNQVAQKFIGNPIDDVPGIIGKVYSANLTQSKKYGIPPAYTDGQLKYMLKTGINKDGKFLSYMLRPNMADSDLNDIIAYLRSDDPAVTPGNISVGITHLNIIGKTAMNMMAKPLPYKPGIIRPANSDKIALGYYLVDNLGCFHCHSKSLTSYNPLNPDQSKGYLAGGQKLKGVNGIEVVVPNITPDKSSGIGDYTQEQFLKTLKEGEAPDRKLHAPMPVYTRLTDMEINAIYAYIQTVPAKAHKVKF